LALGIVDTTGGSLAFAPSLVVNGVGIRVSRQNAPLLDVGVTLGSVALHLFGRVSAAELAGGVQIQLSDLAAGVAGASNGNPIARGMVADSGSGPERLAPSFSPALAIQKHGAGPTLVSLRAGDGDGPWWVAIQKGFGPIYIEQVGFDTTVTQDQLVDISLLLDGRVSIAGLTAAVDDLKLTFMVTSNASIFDPGRWEVDLAGLAVEADLGGVMLAGGLRKFGTGDNAEYVGMLLARLAVYGLSIYGGYGSKEENGERFTSFFAFGAINGPIGGPPAFFLTGIGGGIGINRDLIFPTDLSRFNEFPFIKALDPAAAPSDDPMAELVALRDIFPMKRGELWFAAGISFTSFALVDGIAVISVKIGDGFELAMLGLARVALPRPQVALVSMEFGLLARFSTKEGVLWVQAQLTENSWLLHESVRLTGGYAYVAWFDGPRKGELVLTIGGFHPSFYRDGYPMVPRLGFGWHISSAIVGKGEVYFAMTSEALMAGGKIEVSARFGPAWAEVKFGADGIVYYDPFSYRVEAYARIAAGVTIDVWIGEITISVSLGARLMVEGPKFHGTATFEVGPVEITVPFGDRQNGATQRLPWSAFVPKYLEEAGTNTARCLTALPGKGSLPPGTGASGTGEKGTADGSAEKPFEVFSEFEITITTTIPTRTLSVASASELHPPSRNIGLAPVGADNVDTVLELHFRDTGSTDHLQKLFKDVQRVNGFPVGVWGDPQSDDDRKVPNGEVIEAVGGVRFEAIASIEDSLPHELAYHQVESGPRKPLPFLHARRARDSLILDANATAAVLPAVLQIEAMYLEAMPWLALGGNGATALAALSRERVAPPRLGSLTEGLAADEPLRPSVTLPPDFVRPPVDMTVRPAEAIAILTGELAPELHAPRTTVSSPGAATRVAAPRLADIEATIDWAIPAKLVRMAAPAAVSGRTLIAQGDVPLTRSGQAGVAAVSTRGAASAGRSRLTKISRALAGGQSRARASVAATLRPGEIVVLRLPNAARDVDSNGTRPRLLAAGGPVRLVVTSAGGRILHDGVIGRDGVSVPQGTERMAALATGERSDKQAVPGLLGWHDAQNLPYLGWMTAMVSGGTLRAEGAPVRRNRQRFRAGWVPASELIADAPLIITRFAARIASVAVIIEDPTGAASTQNLSLGLLGADRATDRSKKPLAPTLITVGHRSILVYAIRADEKVGAVQVTVAREEGWRVAGVLGSELDADALADRLTENGIERAVQPLAIAREGVVRLSWSTHRDDGTADRWEGRAATTSSTKVRATKPKRRVKTKRREK
jgi:large repetitive protein